jgi:hypothetical protein
MDSPPTSAADRLREAASFNIRGCTTLMRTCEIHSAAPVIPIFHESRQRKAEAVIAALSMSAIAEREHALSDHLDNPGIDLSRLRGYEAFSNQKVLPVILVDTRYRHISTLEIK